MCDAVGQGVLQARFPDGTFGANGLGDLYAQPVVGKNV
jgi:hypothetical protein